MAVTVQINLDRSSPVPLYHQVASAIERSIDAGELPTGTFLETEIAMASRLGISRPTARQALQELVDKGRLVRKRGVGTQVAPDRIRRSVELTSLHDDLAGSGRLPETRIRGHVTIEADAEISRLLEVPEGTEVVRLDRLRLADGAPLALMRNYLPARTAPTAEELATDGLYAALRARGIRPHVARQRIGARTVTGEEAPLLDEPAGAALLTMERTAYDGSGVIIEHGSHVYRASRYMFDTTVFAD
ncbi:GntR family transcriptional regulator [Bogoriella caseilytica]|uniref:GntR family transcriptional regulator n=1 Tax=Bogoriella caseilytica TaxID=56055 RepID=A0A3N2BD05_9MICO|nr:GntR family transcriptional regulator [Bogoriella caseilytica]ROR73131.1 GntR family transcriptional regulator [Bogoriella caseilytica]